MRRRDGYTLIEVLIVVAIMGLIFGIGFFSFRDYSKKKAVEAIARTLKSDLRLAQGQSLAGKKPTDCTSSLDGYSFAVTTGTPSFYTVTAVCGNQNILIKTATLTSDMSLSVPSVNPILFKPLGQGTNIPSGSSVTITITQFISNFSQVVTVSSTGEIK